MKRLAGSLLISEASARLFESPSSQGRAVVFLRVPMLRRIINILVVGGVRRSGGGHHRDIFDSMKDALCRGENIEIRGLGAFHVKHYDGYQGRNPKTGEVIPVKAKRGILFRTGKELRDRVNRPEDGEPPAGTPGEGQGTPPVAAGA
jgi:integration host factor subunit beta